MEILQKLSVTLSDGEHTILIGMPTTEKEFDDIFRLRFEEYSRRGYIDSSKFPSGREKDDIDNLKIGSEVFYFIGYFDSKLIATVRCIRTTPLPTQKYFEFDETHTSVFSILPEKRIELGRLIVIPPDREKGIFLPRNIVMLFMFYALTQYGMKHGFEGGYAFIKNKLDAKLKKIKLPIERVSYTRSNYPHNDILYNYFMQEDDPVIPIGFRVDRIATYCAKLVNNKFMFKKISKHHYKLRSNLYTFFLRTIRAL